MSYQLWAFTQAGAQIAVLENAFGISREKGANATGTLSFSLPADDAKATYITTAYEIKVYNTIKARFEGLYTLEDSTDRWSSSGKVIECNYSGVMVQLVDEENISYDTGATPLTPTAIVTALLALQERTPAITVGTIEPTTTFCIAVENVNLLKAFQECVSYIGGYIEVGADRKFNWYNEPSGSPTREIRYQKNMKGVTRKRDFTSITNKLYAYGYGETEAQVTLLDAGETYEYIEDSTSQTAYGVHPRRITDKRITHPSTLLAWAQKVLAQYKDPIYSYTVDVVNLAVHPDHTFDLENLEVGQIVRVVNSDLVDPITNTILNVNVKIVKVTENLSNPEIISLELANATKSLSDLIAASADTSSIVNNIAVQIGAGQVTVMGTFTVDGWRTTGQTTIDGGNITAGTITAAKLTITPIVAGGAAADVNANTTTITGGKITTGTLDADAIKTSTLNAKTITLGTTGGDSIIKSGNYSAGSAGWQIKANGDAEFNNVTVRGTIATSTINASNTLTVTGAIQSADFDTSPEAGWQLSGSAATFMDLNVRGDLQVGSAIDATGAISGSKLTSASTLVLSTNISSPATRSLYTDNGLALKWRDANGTTKTITFL